MSNEYKSIVTQNQEIISYPLTYGLFATLDDHYQPLSSTVKVEIFFWVIEKKILNKIVWMSNNFNFTSRFENTCWIIII